jgi:prophage DNA circulation protein
MALRFNPLTALEGSFRGFPFLISRDRRPGGQRGPLHEYPQRDVPYFQALGRKGKRWELTVYFIGVAGDRTGSTADIQAAGFEALLDQGKPGTLVLPGLQRVQAYAQSWEPERSSDKAGWVGVHVVFVEAGRNQYPSSQTSWPHTLLAAALAARTAFGAALAGGLAIDGLPLSVQDALSGSAEALAYTLDIAAQLASSGSAPSSVLAAAGVLTAGFLAALPTDAAPVLDVAALAAATVSLLSGWTDALTTISPDDASRAQAIDALFTVYGEASSEAWYAPAGQSPTEAAAIANQAAFSAAVRRLALTEAARVAASLNFSSYDDAVALRARFADAFDEEVNQASGVDGSREALADLQANTLLAISEAGADKARLTPYTVPQPRSAIGLAQLFYPGDPDVASRAAELAQRNGVVHPSFMPAAGERLSA